MSITFNWRTSATLAGARDFSRIHRVAAQEDIGAKCEKMISAINEVQGSMSNLNAAVSAINAGILSGMTATAAGTSAAFSVFSGIGGFTSAGTTVTRTVLLTVSSVSNFRA